MKKTKYVIIESSGILKPLGGISGPITTPSYIDISVIVSLINQRKVVYEVNPLDRNEKILLTRLNVFNDNFASITNTSTPKNNNIKVDVTKSLKQTSETPNLKDKVNKYSDVDIFIQNKRS